ncbi:mechanosensitive ion channel family protein [Pseudoxanthomonas daejeonensis]|uniref:Small-conductance mechanosensitive channel n=1 Tax=Pseudoxanthomonas daejeonensis TaxID=266062 RepID=A0ABQ6Z682_9GAMM|nr:mechanosensitive ion channel family protein [Pseudoxanthomonas daejeonensis]KAF1693993.1 mechanosensitive ion channel protein MscS [Pseudoxanthomonas daejeonensis]
MEPNAKSSPGGRRHLLAALRGVTVLGLLSLAVALGAAPATSPLPALPGAAPPPAVETPADSEATVRFYNRDIVTLRAEFLGRTPELRARTTEAAIRRVVEESGPVKVNFKQSSEGLLVLLSDELVMMFTTGDLDVLHGETMGQARIAIAGRLQEAVDTARREQAPARLLQGLLWSLLATVIAIALAVGVLWLGRRIRDRLKRLVEARSETIERDAIRHLVGGIRIVIGWLMRVFIALTIFVIIEEWVRFVLGQFGFTRPWAEAMTGWMLDLLRSWAQSTAAALPGLVAAVLIFVLARLLTHSVTITFRGVQDGRFQLFGIDQVLAEPTRKLVNVVIWLFALAMAYPYLPGSETDAFKGLSVLVGLMISLGASGIVGQAAGGFTILYSRTMSVGDYVRSGEVEGVVMQIGLFTTRLRTVAGVEVSIPNNVVLGGQLHNYSRHPEGPGMWMETGVTIGYDAPWRQVHRLLLQAASRTPGVAVDPPPFVLQTALSDFYVDYRLRVRVAEALRRALVLSELHAQIQDAFNAAGVQIMSPNYEADPESPKLVPRAYWDGLPVEPDPRTDPSQQ